MDKLCTKCKIPQEITAFRKKNGAKVSKSGLSPVCRECERITKQHHDLTKKQENPLKYCFFCALYKHYSLFHKSKASWKRNKGNICKECVILQKQQHQRERQFLKIERSIQHQNDTKRCSKCKLFKLHAQFWKSKHTTDGFYSSCIDCTKLSVKTYDKEQRRETIAKWKVKNEDKIKNYRNQYQNERTRIDPNFKLRKVVSSSIYHALKFTDSDKRSKSILQYLPFSIELLKQHLESQFQSWMTWENWGKYKVDQKTWQIDHIIPHSRFLYTSMEDEDFQKCWNLNNLQPLETIANIKKSNK